VLSAVFLLAFISGVAGVSPVFDSVSTSPSNWFTGDSPSFSATVSDSDAGVNASNGTYSGETLHNGNISGANWTSGVYGGALDLTGDTDDVDLPDHLMPNASHPNVTVIFEGTIPPQSANNDHGSVVRGTTNYGLATKDPYDSTGDLLVFGQEYNNQSIWRPTISIGSNKVGERVSVGYKFTYYSNGTTVYKSFVDGSLYGKDSINSQFNDEGGDYRIGDGWAGNSNFTIDDLKIYKKSIPDSKIKQIQNNNYMETDGLAASFRFNAGSGSTAYDTHHRVSRYNNDEGDAGVSFDGDDDQIAVGNPILDLNGDSSFCYDADVDGSGNLLDDYGSGGVTGHADIRSGGGIWIEDRNGNSLRLDGNTDSSVRKDYCVTISPSSVRMFVNGSETDSASNPFNTNMEISLIGRGYNHYWMEGKLYDFVLYNRTLSASEVSTYHNGNRVLGEVQIWYGFENATQRPESRQKNILDYSVVPEVKLDVSEDGQQIVNDAYLQARDWFTPFDGNTYEIQDAFSVDTWNVWYNASLTATDNQGETALTEFNQVSQDDTSPNSTDNWTTSGWVQQSSTTVEFSASDEASVSNITYSLNGGSNNTVSGISTTVTVSEGNNSLEYFATDTAGNQEAVNTEYVALDASPPSLSNDYSATGWVSKSFVSVNYTASDPLSGVANTSYRKNGNSFTTIQSSSLTVDVSQEGNNTIDVKTSDNLGSFNSTTEYVALDTGKPVYNNATVTDSSTWTEWKDSTSPVSKVLFAFNESGQFRNHTWYDYAHYNSSIGAPVCRTKKGGSCVAPSSLLRSKANLGPGEPNSPNTIDNATDGTDGSGSYKEEESIENITIKSLDGDEIKPGHQIEVKAWYYCFSSDDVINIATSDSILSVDWNIQNSQSCDGEGFRSRTTTWNLANYNRSQAIRVLIEYNGDATSTEQTSGFGDQDDIVLDFDSRPKYANKVNVTSNPVGTTPGSFYNFSVNTSFDPIYSKMYADDSAGNWESTGLVKGNVPPDTPVLNKPLDSETVEEQVNLSVDVSDPDSEPLDVTFYWINGSEIGSINNVENGSTVSTTVSNMDYGETYKWYAEVRDGTASTNSSTYSFNYEDLTVPAPRNLDDNVTESVPRNNHVNISAEFRDDQRGLERAVLSTNESGRWMNWTGVSFSDGFEDGDYTSNPVWSDESTGGSTSIISGAAEGSYALQLSDEGRFSGGDHSELVHTREMAVTRPTKFSFYVQMNNVGSTASPNSRVEIHQGNGNIFELFINNYEATFRNSSSHGSSSHILNDAEYYRAELMFYPGNDTVSTKLLDSSGGTVIEKELGYTGSETFTNVSVMTNANGGYSYDFRVDEFKFVNGEYGSPVYLDGAAGAWQPVGFEWRNSSFSGELGYRVWAKDGAGNWNRTRTQSFTVNTPPVFQDAELQWTGIGSQAESRVLEYSINDPDGEEIGSRNNPSNGSVSLFSNSTYRVTGVPRVFDYAASITDFSGASTSRDTNYTLTSSGFRESGFKHDLTRQRINNTVSVDNRGDTLSVNVSVNGSGILTSSERFFGELVENDSTQLTAEYESDYIKGENKTQEELGQNLSRTSTVDTQYLFNQTGLELYNTRNFTFSGVNISSKCSIAQTSDIPAGSSKITTSCDNNSMSGDWISNEKNYSTQYVSGTPLFGSGVDQRYTASQKVEATNVRTDLNLTVDLSGIVSNTGFCTVENSTEQEIAKDSVESLTFTKNCSGGQEASYTPVRKTETSSSYKYEYEAQLEVFSNLTENQSIKYGIPETRLDNFGSREPGETTVSIDGNSNDLSINDAKVIDGTEYVVIKIGDQHGNSSLHEGTHNLSLTYYESKTQGSTSGGDTTGSGSLLVSSGSETTVDENNGSKFSWSVSAITSEDTKSFKISGYPGGSFRQFVVLRNTGESNVSLDIDCVSQDGSCRYVDTDVDSVVLNRNSFTEKNVKVTGELPRNFSSEDAPLTFSIRVTDPAWNGSSTSGESVSYVDFTVTHNPISGRVLDLVYKAGEGFTIESPVDWGNNVTVPFILVPLVLSVLVAGLVGLVEWLAPFSSGWESQRKLAEFLLVFVVFLILYVVIPAGGG